MGGKNVKIYNAQIIDCASEIYVLKIKKKFNLKNDLTMRQTMLRKQAENV